MNNDDLDFFAPAFRIKVDGQPLEQEQEKSVIELVVTHELGTSDQFSVTLNSPYPTLPWTHGKDAELFKPGSGVSIEMGYVDDLHMLMMGEVTALTPNFPADASSTLRVEGHSRLHWLEGTRRTQTYLEMSDSDIVDKIAQDNRLTSKTEKTTLKYPYVIQSNQTDLEFLRQRADGIHFEFFVDDKELVFRKSQAGTSKAMSLKWGETLLRFQPTLNALPTLNKVTVRTYDPKTKEPVVGEAAANATETVMGKTSGAKLANDAFGTRSDMIVDYEAASQSEAEQRAKALLNARMMELITGNGASIGDPTLRAGMVIEITGLGEMFSGLYYVVRTTHTIGVGGYETEFSVKRNAVS